MGLKVATGIDVYHRIDDENSTSVYGSQSTGGQLRAGMPLTSDLSATLFTGMERKVIKDTDAPFSVLVTDGQEFYKAFVGYTLTWNGVDDVKKPTEGLYATFTQQYIGWDHSLIRSEARARYYVPIVEDSGIIGSVRGQAGVINDLSGNGVHAVEAFSPGSQLIRGFEGRGLGPRLINGQYLGAVAYAGASAEIAFPIPGVPENYGLSGAIWADAAWVDGVNVPRLGANTVDPNSIDVPWRTSIGASLIWDSPFGPLRGDFAHVLNKSTADRTQVFQLSMSTLF
jgi:outer membrane protein insertion porin family